MPGIFVGKLNKLTHEEHFMRSIRDYIKIVEGLAQAPVQPATREEAEAAFGLLSGYARRSNFALGQQKDKASHDRYRVFLVAVERRFGKAVAAYIADNGHSARTLFNQQQISPVGTTVIKKMRQIISL
jgi:hypothetical protein